MHPEIRKILSQKDIEWYGDLEDDCSARWAGLILRAEMMDDDRWWWAVSDAKNDLLEIDSSNNHDLICKTATSARTRAETAAKEYIYSFLGL